MGLFDFIKNAGEKIFHPGDSGKEAAVKKLLSGYGSDYSGIDVAVDGNKAVLSGQVSNVTVREKAVLIAGNIDGIDQVDDRLTVPAGAPNFSNVSGGVASTEAPIGSGAAAGGMASAGGEGWQSRTYTVKSGDTLSKISKEMYGESRKYNQIFEANKPMLKDPDKIYPGQVLRIPPEA